MPAKLGGWALASDHQMASGPPRNVGADVGATIRSAARQARASRAEGAGCRKKGLEAATGVEPVMEVLQTSALPLGYAAPAKGRGRR